MSKLTSACLILGLIGAATSARAQSAGWRSEIAADFGIPIGGCAIGDADPTRPGNEIVAVLRDGRILLVYREDGAWKHEQIARSPGEMIQVAIGDARPDLPGQEIVAVGVSRGREDDGGPGAALVIARRGKDWTIEKAFEDRALLHGVGVCEAGLVVAGYSERAHLLRRGPRDWTSELIAKLPGPGRSVVAARGGAAIACKDGALVLAREDKGRWSAREIDRRGAGRARIGASQGHIIASDDDGALSIIRGAAELAGVPEARRLIFQSEDKLRGAILADLDPTSPGLEAATATYTRSIVLLSPGAEAWTARVLANGKGRFHHLSCGELPGLSGLSLVGVTTSGQLVVVTRGPAIKEGRRKVARLERVSTAVPWPRGLVFAEGSLIALARGRHRRDGGPDASIPDRAGTLFKIDPGLAEPVVKGRLAGPEVRANGAVLVEPTAPPFRLWQPSAEPLGDRLTDRPYCTLAWDADSRNFIICGYSGIDSSKGRGFRKNATDSVLRYDLRSRRWRIIEAHDPSKVAAADQSAVVPNDSYPHHDPELEAAPHGWLNGPDGAEVAGRYLYVVAKDNSLLTRYDLRGIRRDPAAPPPPSRVVLRDRAPVRGRDGRVRVEAVAGHSSLAVWGGYLYIGFRTTSQVLRFPLREDGALARPVVGERVAQLAPYDAATRYGADLMDIAFSPRGELYISGGYNGVVWRVGAPDPARPFRSAESEPFLDLRALTGRPRAKCGNITFGPDGFLYLACGNNDVGPETRLRGVIYRARP